MKPSREEALRALIEYRLPVDETLGWLSEYGWDCDAPLATLTRNDLKNILVRYFSAEITEVQITDWADLVECREDIGYPAAEETFLANIIYRLANPNLNEPITRPLIESILNETLK